MTKVVLEKVMNKETVPSRNEGLKKKKGQKRKEGFQRFVETANVSKMWSCPELPDHMSSKLLMEVVSEMP